MNLQWFDNYFCNDDAIEFIINQKLIDNVRFCNKDHQNENMVLIRENRDKMKYIWMCPVCKRTVSLLKGSIFEDSKVSIKMILKIIYMWSHSFSVKLTSHETGISEHSVSSIFNQIKRGCYQYMNREDRAKIGGFNKTVEIDETLFSKRKYQKGRLLNQVWVFGGICCEDNNNFLEIVPDRKASTLFQIINKNVNVGTLLMSDLWSGYKIIDDQPHPQPFMHLSVNHEKNFIDPKTGANTQKCERMWRDFKEKKNQSQGIPRKDYDLYITEYLWRKTLKTSKKDLFIASCEMLSQVKFS